MEPASAPRRRLGGLDPAAAVMIVTRSPAEADVVKKVLFLSSANSVRSQMAEGFLRALAGDAFEAYSAGTVARDVDPRRSPSWPNAASISQASTPRACRSSWARRCFEFLITVCERAEQDCPMFPGPGTREFWTLADPDAKRGSTEERLASFREARDLLEARLRRFLVEHRYRTVVALSHGGASL